jgi:alanine racemase
MNLRATVVDVDLDAIAHNVRAFRGLGHDVMAVVKADAYGHGDVAVARTALEAGASGLGVALVEEGLGLREAGVEGPILVLSECPPGAETALIEAGLTPTICSDAALDRMVGVASTTASPVRVHVKIDTGMHRIGVWPPDAAPGFVDRTVAAGLELEGIWTHLACADTDAVATTRQLSAFSDAVAAVRSSGHRPAVVHAANTAGAIGFPDARLDLVRIGIGLYGLEPAPGLGTDLGLRPAMSWRSTVSHVKRLPAGRRISYGHRYELEDDAWVATVPVGYADGYPRSLSSRADVLIGGRRCRVAGSVTMDQLIVTCGEFEPSLGDEVVLVGEQGTESVGAWELASCAETIAYEIVARVGIRVPRRYAPSVGP